MSKPDKIREASEILVALGMPRGQQNDRTALCLLALLDLAPSSLWREATAPLIGITPIMEWSRAHYERNYAPNTRETFRRQSMHQLVEAGIALYNPDRPDRPVNSPKAVYQIEPTALDLAKCYGSDEWDKALAEWLASRQTLTDRYAKDRDMQMVRVTVTEGQAFSLSAGEHSDLIGHVIEQFAPRFVPGGRLVYAGDTGDKFSYFDESHLTRLGIAIEKHGKMPDVVLHDEKRNWLILVECVTSHGPVDGKRHDELIRLFSGVKAGLVFVTAFPARATMNRYLSVIAWETEVWLADAPSHLIHFNGDRFLGPHG